MESPRFGTSSGQASGTGVGTSGNSHQFIPIPAGSTEENQARFAVGASGTNPATGSPARKFARIATRPGETPRNHPRGGGGGGGWSAEQGGGYYEQFVLLNAPVTVCRPNNSRAPLLS